MNPFLTCRTFVALAMPCGLAAQLPVAVLLKDINTVPTVSIDRGSFLRSPVVLPASIPGFLGSSVDDDFGRELTFVDIGTGAPLVQRYDTWAGPGGGDPQEVTVMPNGAAVFVGDDPDEGRELRRWTQAGGVELVGTGDGPLGLSFVDLFYAPSPHDFVTGVCVEKTGSYTERASLITTDGQTVQTIAQWGDVAIGTFEGFWRRHVQGDDDGLIAYYDGYICMSVDDGTHGRELAISDFTVPGTDLLDLVPGIVGSDPYGLTVAGDVLYMGATLATVGTEVARYDGTSVVAATDIHPNGGCDPRHLTEWQDSLCFSADDGASGREPWMIDANGAVSRIADLAQGAGSSDPHDFSNLGATLAWTADDGSGFELFTKTGTGAPVKYEFQPGPGGGDPSRVVAGGGSWFTAATAPTGDRQLYESTDQGGSWLLRTTARAGQGGVDPRELSWIDAIGKLLFRGSDDTHEDEAFLYDAGTGVVTLVELNGATTGTAASGAGGSGFTYSNGRTYFQATNGVTGGELWRSDGTAAGTEQVADLNPGLTGSLIDHIVELSDTRLVLVADEVGVTGKELYSFDTATEILELVKDIRPGPLGSNPIDVFGPVVLPVLPAGPRLCFRADDGLHGRELWVTDGTTQGTFMLGDLNPASAHAHPRYFAQVGSVLVFSANDGTHGEELWATIGGAPYLVRDIFPGSSKGAYLQTSATAIPFGPGTQTEYLYFGAHAPGETGLWRTDGMTAESVVTLQPGSLLGLATNLASYRGEVYFQMQDGLSGAELWKSDGTPGNATFVADIDPGGPGSNPRILTVAGDRLFLVANQGSQTSLFAYDGAALTRLDIGLAPSHPGPRELVPHGDVVFFEGGGGELWVSDGTESGTRQTPEFRLGPNGPMIRDISVAGGQVWVSADDGVRGVEAYLVHTTLPATATSGTPCGPDQPSLAAAPPTLGEDLELSGTAPQGTFGLIAIGDPPIGPRLPLFGCGVQVDPIGAIIAHVFVSVAGGPWTFTTQLPATANLANVTMAAWVLFLPANASDPAQASNGVLLRLGR